MQGDEAGLQEVFIYLIEHLLLQVPLNEQPMLVFGATRVGRNWEITCTANGPDPEPGGLRDLFRLFHNRTQQVSADSTLNKLAVAKRIIEYMNGELKSGQAPGGGIQFTITIPSAMDNTGG